ncbi:uncharacterized protein SCODWIG_00655 [Saccharomycodes ludwigii]|uniref:CBS domain-containing protein n=1 Tax=Saccharomycodes ludwigii TaxID=36035 RepID=A0A376B347_9ASCO|nr:hypothetical protein SCDLUD_004424 [Saccharomycodes ludwigii]KAH3899003.1 hypothetical protein SCDLUD_004424 [Saccharomycodes ludwigii]SSD58894.1 uncharacterized protein SCODWIG_00655 [Saccharomycodes ludwigii]
MKSIITLSNLPLDPPLGCSVTDDVRTVAQRFKKLKVHCLLVYSQNKVLVGVITTKDLAFRSNLNSNVKIKDIYTRNPLIIDDHTELITALRIMCQKKIRHLIIKNNKANNHEDIVGIFDITKNLKKVIPSLDRFDYNYSLKMVLQDGHYFTKPVIIGLDSTISEALALMRKYNTTAILVKDVVNNTNAEYAHQLLDFNIIGILTSKDIVYRVLVDPDIEPSISKITRVMTIRPNFAYSSNLVSEALQMMFKGNFLNLPVIDENEQDKLIGMVSVLQLTHAEIIAREKEENDLYWETFKNALQYPVFLVFKIFNCDETSEHKRSLKIENRIKTIRIMYDEKENIFAQLNTQLKSCNITTDNMYFYISETKSVKISSDRDLKQCLLEKQTSFALYRHNLIIELLIVGNGNKVKDQPNNQPPPFTTKDHKESAKDSKQETKNKPVALKMVTNFFKKIKSNHNHNGSNYLFINYTMFFFLGFFVGRKLKI